MNRFFSSFFSSIAQVSRPFWISCVLFAAGAWIGATNESFHAMLNGQMSQIRDLAKNLQERGNPTLSFFLFIFFNNAIKALFVMAAGILFGAFPVFFLVMNGMVLGYLWIVQQADIGVQATLLQFIKGILPHGIIEIPVIILASAYGLKNGSFLWRWLGTVLRGRDSSSLTGEWKLFTRRLVPAGAGIVLLLLLASLVESTLTRWILQL